MVVCDKKDLGFNEFRSHSNYTPYLYFCYVYMDVELYYIHALHIMSNIRRLVTFSYRLQIAFNNDPIAYPAIQEAQLLL